MSGISLKRLCLVVIKTGMPLKRLSVFKKAGHSLFKGMCLVVIKTGTPLKRLCMSLQRLCLVVIKTGIGVIKTCDMINSSTWIFIMPLMLLLGLIILLLAVPEFSRIEMLSGFNFSGISEGVVEIMPLMGVGLGIAMLVLVFAFVRRSRA